MNALLELSLLSEKRWPVTDWSAFDDIAANLSPADREIVGRFDAIAEGELRGLGMQYELARLLQQATPEDRIILAEAWAYMPIIVYEEFRHGIILAKLMQREHDSLASCSFDNQEPWQNPYELLVSLLVGEIVNVELYRAAAHAVEGCEIKSVLTNITSDEARHKAAWMRIVEGVCRHERGRKMVAAALKSHGHVHQAEIGDRYAAGAAATLSLIDNGTMVSIVSAKHKYFSKVLGDDMPVTYTAMLSSQVKAARKLMEQQP